MAPRKSWGLSCAPVVRWLIEKEPDLRNHIRAFAMGRVETDKLNFALSPTPDELLKSRLNRFYRPALPCVLFTLKMLKDPAGVEVICSDEDLEKLVKEHDDRRFKATLPVGLGY